MRLDANGRAVVEARIARTGVQLYKYPDIEVRELRPPETVFDPVAMATYRGLPVTVGHADWVTAANVQTLAIGYVQSVRQDGRYLAATMIITDAAAIEAMKRGTLREWSAGYHVELEETAGVTPAGEKYDVIQRDIRANHVALLPPGGARCGSGCSVTSLSA